MTSRLRIAYVVHDYNHVFGQSRYVAELVARFKQDHDVHIFANTFDEPNPDGLTFHRVPALRFNVLASVLTFALPATWMVRGRYDIIHAQGFCGLQQNVVTAHICQAAWCAAQDQHDGRPGWRKRIFHGLAQRLERLLFRPGGGRRFIAVSARLRDDLAGHYGCDEDVRVIHHGVDTETFHPRNVHQWRTPTRQAHGIPDEVPLALYVGDLQKALPAAIRGVARVPGLHLACVSRSPVEPYRDLIDKEGIAQRVHLIPATRHVERYYAAADLFVFPTFYDSFGMVATEAMASGLPVVCSRAAGAAELIDDGADGLLVDDAWQPEPLAAALNRLVGNPGLRQRLGCAARQKMEHCTWDEVARQTMAVYREIAVKEHGMTRHALLGEHACLP